MKILGLSGLHASMSFKRTHWPGLDEREYRMSQGHDSAAALLVDGEIVAAAAEERFNGRKHTGEFPVQAIGFCLAEAGLSMHDVDELAHGFDYSKYRRLLSLDELSRQRYQEVYSKEALLGLVEQHFDGFPLERVHQVEHHDAHAASAYYTSGWDACVVIVIDGMGEAQSITAYGSLASSPTCGRRVKSAMDRGRLSSSIHAPKSS